jgi:hypothetical protein
MQQASQNFCISSLATHSQRFLSPPSSCKEGRLGSIGLSKIQNTFIHSPKLPPTPLQPGAARRARSLPKDLGSERNHWEATCQALGCSYVEQNLHSDLDGVVADGWGATPNIYNNPKGLYSLASSPAFIPNSPALTASPTLCSTDCQVGGPNPQKLLLRLETSIDQTHTKASLPQRIICLADLVE